MTEQAPVAPQVWVLDAMCLIHFGRAERLDVLRDLLVGKECWTTQVVLEELRQGSAAAVNLIDALRATGLRLPCTGAEFPGYARQHGLL